MKKFSLALAALLGFAVLTPSTAEAGGCRTRVTYDSCGTCLHWEYRCVGRAYDGCPVYRWVVVSRSYPRASYGYGYGYGSGIHLHIGGGHSHRGHSHRGHSHRH
ncbi:MAG TPA: hypothetical protein VG796_27760 [Verrucomicrobiales bacterium]|nr:hypothetical protein [Verrucomicrobiales bacterium]